MSTTDPTNSGPETHVRPDVPPDPHDQKTHVREGTPAGAPTDDPAWGVPTVIPVAAPSVPTGSECAEAVLGGHVGGLLLSFILPLIVFLARRERSPFVAHHAREALNFQVTIGLAWISSTALAVVA